VIVGRHVPHPQHDSSPSDHPAASLVRAELDRILASELFTRSERLSAFLKFIVDHTLAGRGDSLKEQVIAVELYGKGTDFNTAADPIVRVDARRLRDRLREYYATAPDRGIVISVPKGSYTPVFHGNAADVAVAPSPTARNTGVIHDGDTVVTPAGPATSAGASTADRGSRRWWIAGARRVVIAAASWGVLRLRTGHGSEPTRLLTVTSLPGAEEDPSLSPDGNFVAFSWAASPNGNANIWIKAVDGDALRQLTDTPDAIEKFPAWSPRWSVHRFYTGGERPTERLPGLGTRRT
jgi:hypothetical protein